jgi:hypothetical protein
MTQKHNLLVMKAACMDERIPEFSRMRQPHINLEGPIRKGELVRCGRR